MIVFNWERTSMSLSFCQITQSFSVKTQSLFCFSWTDPIWINKIPYHPYSLRKLSCVALFSSSQTGGFQYHSPFCESCCPSRNALGLAKNTQIKDGTVSIYHIYKSIIIPNLHTWIKFYRSSHRTHNIFNIFNHIPNDL